MENWGIFVVAGLIAGAFGGRTGMLMLWKAGVRIVEIPTYDDETLTRREEAIMIGTAFGGILGGIVGGAFASFGLMQGIIGLLVSAVSITVVYLALLCTGYALMFVLGGLARGLGRVSDALVSLVPGKPKEE